MKNSKLTLASGRTIQLVSLRQEATYYGLLEGLPTREMNAGTIERLSDDARERTRQAEAEVALRAVDWDRRAVEHEL